MNLKEYVNKNPEITGKSFLHRNPDLLEKAKELMIEADDLGISDTQLAIYMVQTIDKMKNKSHNTVRRYFKDIRLGLYD